MKKNSILANLIYATIALVVIVLVFPSPEEVHFKFEENKPWNYAQLIAPCDIPIRQDSATVNARMDSLDTYFVPVFYRDRSTTGRLVSDEITRAVQQASTDGLSADDARLLRRVSRLISDDVYRSEVVADAYGDRIASGHLAELRVHEPSGTTISKISTSHVKSPSSVIAYIQQEISDPALPGWLERYRIKDLLKPNLVYDDSISAMFYHAEESFIKGALGTIQQGQAIIDKGKIITHQDYINILTYEEYVNKMGSHGQNRLLLFLGHLLYASLLLGALLVYLSISAPQVWSRSRSVAFLLLVVTLFFVIGVGCEHFIESGMYLVPFAVVPILLVVFFNPQLALFVSMILTLLCAPCGSFALEFVVLQFAASIAAVYSLRELSRRAQLLRTALFVFGSYLVTYLAIEMLMNGTLATLSLRMTAFIAVSALLCSTAYILMAAAEKAFGFVSVVTLVELCDPNNPLLRKLSEECPGTFQHSMSVGTLATDAAIKIGANEQLVRAGAMYHDIGKMANPNFFTENQRGVNPHDALPPEQSAKIIIQHVTDGLARADRAGLPEVIKSFIREHHGRGKAKYFYFTYCKAHPDEVVDPAPFTYPGPNPQSRETSLLMMADAVEAASRSLKEHTPEAIKDLVNKIIDGQIADGLHNDSALSFRDVQIIKQEFTRRLMTMYHSRISYPDDPNKKKAATQIPAEGDASTTPKPNGI